MLLSAYIVIHSSPRIHFAFGIIFEYSEVTAKDMYNDKSGEIKFKYDADDGTMKFYLRDARARDCLVKTIEIQLPLIDPRIATRFFQCTKI